MAVETREMSSFTLTRSPQHVAISATKITTTASVAGVRSYVQNAVVTDTTESSSNRKAANRLSSQDNDHHDGAREPNPYNEQEHTLRSGKSVEPRPRQNEDESEGARKERVVNSGWLMRRYNVLAEELDSSVEISEKTKLEKCTNCSFQAYIACKCKRASPKINTQKLSNARTLGIKSCLRAVGSDLFSETPVGSIVREFVVYGGSFFMVALWVTILAGFILRLINNDRNRGDNYFLEGKVGFSSLGTILTLLDLVQHMCMHRCTSCTERTRGSEWRSETPDKFELTDEHDDKEFKGCCKKQSNYDRAGIIRFFITPLIIYPLLLLSIFQFLSEVIIGQVNITTVLSLVLIVIMQICFFYLVRMFIFLGTVHTVQKIRTGGANGRALLKDSYFQLYFVVSAFGQMVVELLITAAIGIRIYDDYLAFFNADTKPVTFIPSPQLWYMMVFGYFATPVGLVMFFISHYYCTQRFFIKFYLDVLSVLEKKVNVKNAYSKNSALSDFKKMEETFCGHKCFYSFISPTIALLSILYFSSACAFLYCSLAFSVGGSSTTPQATQFVMNVFTVLEFYLGATIVAILVNFHTIAIAYFWIFAFFAFIALAILSIPIIIVGWFCYGIYKNPPPPPQPKLDAPPDVKCLPYTIWTYEQKKTYRSPYGY